MTQHAASAFARAGLAGHPSDGYGGATLSVTLRNFSAEVTVESAGTRATTPVGDGAPGDAPATTLAGDGAPADAPAITPVGDGARLVEAAIARFTRDVAPLPNALRVRFETTIPRECGLGGSSAIVIATLRALAQLAGTTIERQRLAHIALACETEELGIAAGLQDRVVQAHGGLVFMDFARDAYEPLDATLLPPLFVAWDENSGGASGRAHAAVKTRFEQGDPHVTSAMITLAQIAQDARAALLAHDHGAFGLALTAGYEIRARIFDLDPRHMAMIDAARALGLPATYTGSGGAIVGLAHDAEAVAELKRRLGHVTQALV